MMSDEKAEAVDPGDEKIFKPFVSLKFFWFCHRRRRKIYWRSSRGADAKSKEDRGVSSPEFRVKDGIESFQPETQEPRHETATA